MRAKWVEEVRTLIEEAPFQEWVQAYSQARRDVEKNNDSLEQAQTDASIAALKADRLTQQAEDAVFAAGDFEDMAAAAHAENAEIENTSFEVLGAFEAQRKAASDAWTNVSNAERNLEDARAQLSELSAELAATRNAKKAPDPTASAVAATAPEAQGDAALQEKQGACDAVSQTVNVYVDELDAMRKQLEADVALRDELWQEVEQRWAAALAANMARAEYTYRAETVRGTVEAMFDLAKGQRQRHTEHCAQVEALETHLTQCETRLLELAESARLSFDCALIDSFLYWPLQENPKVALCVPLESESSRLNMQVEALHVYQVDRSKGIEFIEPVPESVSADEDPRLHDFFTASSPQSS